MSASLGSAFGKTVQTITSTKLKELAEQRATFEEKYNTLIGTEYAESDAMRRVCLLLEGSKECLGVQAGKKTKDGRPGHVIANRSHNSHLTTDLRNLGRFI